MSASAMPDDNVVTSEGVIKLRQKLGEHGTMIGALERGQRSTQGMVRGLHSDIAIVKKSVHDVAEDVGKVTGVVVRLEEKMDGITGAFTTLANSITGISEDFRKHQQGCTLRHKEIDGRFDSIDEFEVDTQVYESMSGKEVKTLMATERAAREELTHEVNELKNQAIIHQAEKRAVEDAKARWRQSIEDNDKERRVTEQERNKLKIARYSMYGVVIAGMLTIAGNVLMALLNN